MSKQANKIFREVCMGCRRHLITLYPNKDKSLWQPECQRAASECIFVNKIGKATLTKDEVELFESQV